MRNPRVMQHIGKGPMSRDEVSQLVDCVQKCWHDFGMGWAIRLKMDNRVIGQICLQPLSELHEIGVGYGLAPSSWEPGFAEEALNEVLGRRNDVLPGKRGSATSGTMTPALSSRSQSMNWHRRFATLLVLLALAGCAPAAMGQGQAPYAPYSPENMQDRGGDGGGGGGGGSM